LALGVVLSGGASARNEENLLVILSAAGSQAERRISRFTALAGWPILSAAKRGGKFYGTNDCQGSRQGREAVCI